MKRDFTGFSFCSRLTMECTAMQIPLFFFSAAWRAVSPYSGRNWHTPDKCPGCPLPIFGSACFWNNACRPATSPVRHWKPVYRVAGCQPRTCGTWHRTSANPPVKSHPPAALSLSVQNMPLLFEADVPNLHKGDVSPNATPRNSAYTWLWKGNYYVKFFLIPIKNMYILVKYILRFTL